MRITHHQVLRERRGAIAASCRDLLIERQKADPTEVALYAYIPLFDGLATRLGTAVGDKTAAQAARDTRLVKLENADDEVDRWYRHTYNHLDAESLRRTGGHGPIVLALLLAAFPDRLARIDDHVEDENEYLHKASAVLRAPEHAPLLAAIGFPMSSLDNLDAALAVSDAALDEVEGARDDRKGAIGHGQGAADEWADAFTRYRKYIASRATKRGNPALYKEGQELLAPLVDELDRIGAERAARATREKHAAEDKAKADAEKAAEDKAKADAEKAAEDKAKADAEKKAGEEKKPGPTS